MKIAHLVSGLQRASGVSVFVGELAAEQVAQGHTVAILTHTQTDDIYPVVGEVKVVCQSLDEDIDSSVDLVHIHALWDPWLTRMARRFRAAGTRIVWSPHGMLTLWALKNKWWKKILGLLLYQYAALRGTDLIHVTAPSEVEDMCRLRLSNRLLVAPLGVRLPKPSPCQAEKNGLSSHTLLFVSRVQRKKGLPNLLEAWARLPQTLKGGWRVQIAGPDQDHHTAELRAHCVRLGIKGEVEFLGPVYGKEKDDLYQRADLFVLPTYSENFGSVVVEALAAGTPVVCTKGAPWKELEEVGCGWWIDIGVEALVKALVGALALSDEDRIRMGIRGRLLVERKYTWSSVASKILEAYGDILGRDECVDKMTHDKSFQDV